MRDPNSPISLVAVGCMTRFHSPRTARLQSGQRVRDVTRTPRGTLRVGPMAPKAATHDETHTRRRVIYRRDWRKEIDPTCGPRITEPPPPPRAGFVPGGGQAEQQKERK